MRTSQVVDALYLSRQLQTLEACRQVALADCLLLNKSESCDQQQLARLTAQLRTLNAVARTLIAVVWLILSHRCPCSGGPST